MTRTAEHRLSRGERLLLAATGAVLVTLLVVAAALSPDPNGFGTHRQLGLPPCTFRVLFNMRCPSCGMTTSWSNMMRGHWVRALQSNTAGCLLAIASVVAGPWMLLSAGRGRWLGPVPNERLMVASGLLFVVVALADWAYRLWAG